MDRKKKRTFKEAPWKNPHGDSGKWIISAAQMTRKDTHTHLERQDQYLHVMSHLLILQQIFHKSKKGMVCLGSWLEDTVHHDREAWQQEHEATSHTAAIVTKPEERTLCCLPPLSLYA